MSIEEAKSQLNLKVLQRIDRRIVSIINTTSHVVLYQYTTKWSKTGTEGTLFLVNGHLPQVIILNRVNTENYVIELNVIKEFQEMQDYLIYSYDGSIFGLWIFGIKDRKALFDDIELNLTQKISLNEIWTALESMGSFESILSEGEFSSRFEQLMKVVLS